MSNGHILLGLLADSSRHGYDLKREYDERFPAARPLAFGQIYATLARLQKKNWVVEAGVERVDGPDRTTYAITQEGRKELESWLEHIDEPAPFVANPLAAKATIALCVVDEEAATRYLRRQRSAHLERMRHYTRKKTSADASTAEVLAADYAIAHLDADLRWLDTALERVRALDASAPLSSESIESITTSGSIHATSTDHHG